MNFRNGKCLVAYFSHEGNTKVIAEMIAQKTGADIFKIESTTGYPKEYIKCTEAAKKEKDAKARPQLTEQVGDMSKYDVIFVGYPNWWSTCPMPIYSFLEAYNLEEKTVAPFCTHGGGGFGSSETDIKETLPASKVVKGLAVRGDKVQSAENDVDEWLKNI